MSATTFIPKDPNFKEKVAQSFNKQKFMQFIGAELISVTAGSCEIKIPFSEDLTQQHGFFHAGIVSTIADNAAGYAAFSLMEVNSSVLTVEYKINLMAPAIGDYLVGIGQVIKNGKNLTVCETKVYAHKNGQVKLCASSQATLIELKNSVDGKVT